MKVGSRQIGIAGKPLPRVHGLEVSEHTGGWIYAKGLQIHGGVLPGRVRDHFQELIRAGVLVLVK